MIDFHSHILPQMDDGSSCVEESTALLKMLSEQGVDCVCATPHFDVSHRTPRSFLSKRAGCYEKLKPALDPSLPRVLLGAEVAYYPGISRLEGLTDLRLAGTKLLLLEMPMCAWSQYMVKELIDLSCSKDTTVLLAHVERYLDYQKNDVLEKLLESGVLMQVNTSFFLEKRTKRTALKLLGQGRVHLLGTDCHNLELRPPQMGEALAVIRKKLGEEFIAEMDAFGHYLLNPPKRASFSKSTS